jgi:hypothetical protein
VPDALSDSNEEGIVKHENRWAAVVLLLASLPLAGCGKGVDIAAEAEAGPATVEHLEGAEPARMTLTEDAVRRLDIQTATVREAAIDGAMRIVVPYAAVLYDTKGDTWTYTNPSPRVFVRHHIVVDHVTNNQAVLTDGPPVGMAVVIVGVAELYGSETEFEEE